MDHLGAQAKIGRMEGRIWMDQETLPKSIHHPSHTDHLYDLSNGLALVVGLPYRVITLMTPFSMSKGWEWTGFCFGCCINQSSF